MHRFFFIDFFYFSHINFYVCLQLHVLAYSLHSILNGMRSILKTGDLDPCLDIFGKVHMHNEHVYIAPGLILVLHTVILPYGHSRF